MFYDLCDTLWLQGDVLGDDGDVFVATMSLRDAIGTDSIRVFSLTVVVGTDHEDPLLFKEYSVASGASLLDSLLIILDL